MPFQSVSFLFSLLTAADAVSAHIKAALDGKSKGAEIIPIISIKIWKTMYGTCYIQSRSILHIKQML
jgi:hypothetical protein